ncbi:hypothetical protein K6Y32_31355 [Burkholderia cenocepacia]|nr:hypothetical protein [Burkholderia cenocepacia]
MANLNLADVQKRVQIANYEKVIQSAFLEVSDGIAARGTYDQRIAALERNEHVQQRRLDLSDLCYRSGVDSHMSVQSNLYNAEQTLISARLTRRAKLADLHCEQGGGSIQRAGEASCVPEATADYDKAAASAPVSAANG